MNVQEFFDKYNGKGLNPDNAYGNQCVDLADQYAVEVVGSPLPPVNGAKDFWSKNLVGYEKIPNTPDGVPQLGDIIIWTNGLFGHIAVFKEGDANRFTSFDQNFPTQGYYDNQGNFIGTGVCHFQEHNYTSVAGWFHPKNQPTQPQPSAPVINDQTTYDFGGDIGVAELGAIRSKVNDLTRDLNNSQTTVRGQIKEIIELKNQVTDCQFEVEKLQANATTGSQTVTKTVIVTKDLVFTSSLANFFYSLAKSLG